MITDLIELTRVRLGGGILIKPTHTCMRRICTNVIEEMKAIYPKRTFHLNCDDEFPGEWDEARMSQVLSNLLGNAIQHGDVKTPVTVRSKATQMGWNFRCITRALPFLRKCYQGYLIAFFKARRTRELPMTILLAWAWVSILRRKLSPRMGER